MGTRESALKWRSSSWDTIGSARSSVCCSCICCISICYCTYCCCYCYYCCCCCQRSRPPCCCRRSRSMSCWSRRRRTSSSPRARRSRMSFTAPRCALSVRSRAASSALPARARPSRDSESSSCCRRPPLGASREAPPWTGDCDGLALSGGAKRGKRSSHPSRRTASRRTASRATIATNSIAKRMALADVDGEADLHLRGEPVTKSTERPSLSLSHWTAGGSHPLDKEHRVPPSDKEHRVEDCASRPRPSGARFPPVLDAGSMFICYQTGAAS
ncbi:hypothetical protein GGR56DRAFT_346667 [Xylariaceae sp. FL0804]|nr:hypothetical protein GGR56DRAFT_346667 [Xylariaceae sp. FL0804]